MELHPLRVARFSPRRTQRLSLFAAAASIYYPPRSVRLIANSASKRAEVVSAQGSSAIPEAARPPREKEKEKVIVLGSGWGGYIFSRKLSDKKYSCTVVSPRSYFVFTPLLTDTAAGNLDFSSVVEPVRDRKSKVDFIQAAARQIDFKRKVVICEPTIVKSGVTESPRVEDDEREYEEGPDTGSKRPQQHLRQWEQAEPFEVPYDKLVISTGCVSQTFKTPGVRENAMFFRDVGDSKRVKRRVRECFELAVLPTTSEEMQRYLLHFAIVGAGPTGTELAASLHDFIVSEMDKLYPALRGKSRITLYDIAPRVLNMFDESLSRYAMEVMQKEGIEIKTGHHVQELRWGTPNTDGPHEMDPKGCLTLKTQEEGEVGVGLCVWATGNAMNKFIKYGLNEVKEFPLSSVLLTSGERPSATEGSTWHVKKAPRTGALLVDGHFRVQLESSSGHTAVLQDVFAIGDNSMLETGAPPMTAQAASQEAKWLAERLNQGDLDKAPNFSFRNMGMLAYIGSANALMQIPHELNKENGRQRNRYLPDGLRGRTAWLVWKLAYLSMSMSWRNRVRILFRWMVNRLFGNDVSRF
ncbi:hypothetical protein VTN77DRAFT_9728 [Rasamsonia byssochlamydoides]|uniref:uncharacterized protein n=1 Tax=Rasamsonia byssochlamydoides TaxID=89139 RepID=UPI00374425E4